MAKGDAKDQIKSILDNNYGVNSGVYSAVIPSIEMVMNDYGQYEPIFTKKLSDGDYKKLAMVDMMTSYSPDEDELAAELFSKQSGRVSYDSVVGYYTSLYAGYVVGGGYRSRASSGGMTSWILVELLRQKLIDGVIHMKAVDPKKNDGKLFKYAVSTSQKSIKEGAKSRYYPGELSEVLEIVRDNPKKKYAVVGIPEFITEIRLLARVDKQIKKQIVYTVGLVCGHQKTAKYAEALAWQQGIKPGDLQGVDFRIKQPESTAIDYLHKFTGKIDGKKVDLLRGHKDLFCGSWAHGLFKSNFSDYTDNVFNETADVVLGDAWLPKYNKDGMGSNIVIVRNLKIDKIIKSAIKSGNLSLDEIDAETIKRSQQGLIHHERDELPYRLKSQKKRGLWVPRKRYESNWRIPPIRREVQDIRREMATSSHEVYKQAVEKGDWSIFQDTISPMIDKYRQLYKRIDEQGGETGFKGLVSRTKKAIRVRTRLRSIKRRLRIRTRLRSLMSRRDYARKQRINDNPDGVILTLAGYFNYGNVIQRYALQEFLLRKGYKFASYERTPIKDISDIEPRLRNLRRFVDRYIARVEYSGNDNFPAYIVGSDQVWRNWNMPKERGDIGYFFYDFVKDDDAKRISYAASFGLDTLEKAKIDSSLKKTLTPLVKKFDAISVREKSGVDIIKDNWDIDAQVVLDPTMLFSKSDYSRIINRADRDLRPIPGVFSYILAPNKNKATIIDRVAKSEGLKKYALHPRKQKVLPPVEQWLKGFRDAEVVVTDSFHGTVFSIINNTPFVVIENEYGGNARMESILSSFGLEDRLVSEDKADEFEIKSMKQIDWQSVNSKLEAMKKDSVDWLMHALKEAGNAEQE